MRIAQRMAAFALAGAFALSVPAFAQRPGRGQGAAAIPPAMMSKLNLTAEQQEKLKAAQATLQADMSAAMSLTTPQEKRQAQKSARDKYMAAVTETLTDEQEAQLKTMQAEAQEYRSLGPVGPQLVGLNLTTDQKTKVKEIGAKYEPELKKLAEERRNPSADKKALAAQGRELNQKIITEVKAVLTPEQQQKLGTAAAGARPKRKKQQ